MPAAEPAFEILRSAADGADAWSLAVRVPDDSRLVAGHFPGRPIVPGVALLALVARAAADWRGEAGEILALRGVKLRRPVAPGDTLAVRLRRLEDGGAGSVAFELRRAEGAAEPVATGQARLGRRAAPGPSGSPAQEAAP